MRRALLTLAAWLVLGSVSHAQNQPATFAQPATVTTAWTSATAKDTALTLTTTNFATALITLNGVAPLTGGRLAFECDNGTSSWLWPVAGYRTDSPNFDTVFTVNAVNQSWQMIVASWTQCRVRLDQVITGAGTANLSITMSAAPSEVATPQATALSGSTATRGLPITFPGPLGRLLTPLGGAYAPVSVPTYSLDPCSSPNKGNAPISQTSGAKLVSGVGNRRIFVCSIFLVAADAENISLVEGTGTVCATGTAAVIGSTTAANGPNLAANGGWVEGTGLGAIAIQAGMGNDVCLLQSGSGRVAGNLTYALQ